MFPGLPDRLRPPSLSPNAGTSGIQTSGLIGEREKARQLLAILTGGDGLTP